MKKIIFLDIDGVLTNQYTKWDKIDQECVSWLNWLVEFCNAEVILTSSRRNDNGIEAWLKDGGLKADIAGKTAYFAKFDERLNLWISTTRGAEIQAWLDNNEWDRFIILDDDDDMDDLKSYLIQTETNYGLNRKIALKAATALLV